MKQLWLLVLSITLQAAESEELLKAMPTITPTTSDSIYNVLQKIDRPLSFVKQYYLEVFLGELVPRLQQDEESIFKAVPVIVDFYDPIRCETSLKGAYRYDRYSAISSGVKISHTQQYFLPQRRMYMGQAEEQDGKKMIYVCPESVSEKTFSLIYLDQQETVEKLFRVNKDDTEIAAIVKDVSEHWLKIFDIRDVASIHCLLCICLERFYALSQLEMLRGYERVDGKLRLLYEKKPFHIDNIAWDQQRNIIGFKHITLFPREEEHEAYIDLSNQ